MSAYPGLPPAILLEGRPHRIEVRVAPVRHTQVIHVNGALWVLLSGTERRSPEAVLETWLRERARAVIYRRLADLAGRHGFRYRRVFIRDQRTRWGSCSNRGNLSFNFRLIMAPPEVLDYVILHELVHLREPNHSARFWAALARLCPDYRERRRWLRRSERQLMDALGRR
ncbi:SprT family zinc-dependent metalloprotease [Carboxydochorda subterranea]|uniref:SprT family zinc-dependent metalloprotease n=1 Tax=Carboxydichorda subterranea TaxID=3109565 RepID=A0ABZ1BW73_9FIRM|nr:SprT family zinc-dependent metalloprotease [Limnochorda sp. L945t]WRP16775.1 SprT family zinc-dependent metalloprotease [Limnochorda sp. L945t]